MAKSFTAAEAGIVLLFIESVTYGIYLVSLGFCLRALLCHRDRLIFKQRRHVRWWVIIVTLSMTTIATVDVAVNLRESLQAFAWDSARGDAVDVLNDSNNWMNMIGYVDYIAQSMLGDAILLYRAYVVYNKSVLVIMVPALIYLGGLTCAISVFLLGTVKDLLNDDEFYYMSIASFATTVVLNVLTTSLIAVKLWKAHNRIAPFAARSTRLTAIIRIILDSAVVYTASVLILACTLVLDNVSLPISAAIVQIIGISFNLVIIRVQAVSQELNEETYPRVAAEPSHARELGGMKASAGSSEGHWDIPPPTTATLSTSRVPGSAMRSTDYSRAAGLSHQVNLVV